MLFLLLLNQVTILQDKIAEMGQHIERMKRMVSKMMSDKSSLEKTREEKKAKQDEFNTLIEPITLFDLKLFTRSPNAGRINCYNNIKLFPYAPATLHELKINSTFYPLVASLGARQFTLHTPVTAFEEPVPFDSIDIEAPEMFCIRSPVSAYGTFQ